VSRGAALQILALSVDTEDSFVVIVKYKKIDRNTMQ